jgi:hypothetical protein
LNAADRASTVGAGGSACADVRHSAAALDFGANGVRVAFRSGSGVLTVSLKDEGLCPPNLITWKEGDPLPSFPSLLDRLGEDRLVSIAGSKRLKPHEHLRDLLGNCSLFLNAWGPVQFLGIVVSAFANDLQRSWILKAANAAGWPRVRLVNKTTALAAQGLKDRPDGKYLAVVFGHGPAEASVVHWERQTLRSLSYSQEPELCGDALDRCLMQHGTGFSSLFSEYSEDRWIWLRKQAELVRRRLSFSKTVTLRVWGLPGETARQISFERAWCQERMDPLFERLSPFLERCCGEAGLTMNALNGCFAAGGLLLQPRLREVLTKACHQTGVDIMTGHAQLLGAAEIAENDEVNLTASGAHAERPVMESAPAVIDIEAPPQAGPAALFPSPKSITDFAEQVKNLLEMDKAEEVRAYVSALKAHLQEVGNIVNTMIPDGSPRIGSASSPSHGEASHRPRPEKDRRAHARAMGYIRQAELELQRGRPEQALLLSHSARQASMDGTVFRAMIEIHLQAAASRPPSPETFADDKRWLLCALSDDGSNHRVQRALADRFIMQAKQLAANGNDEARARAIATLEELSEHLPRLEEVELLFAEINQRL